MFGADTAAARLSHTRSPLGSRLCGMGSLILSVHSGNDSLYVHFSSMIRFSLTAAKRGSDGQQRQVKVDTVVSCFIRINLQNWHSC